MNELPILPPADVTTQQLYVLIAQMNLRITAQNEELTELRESVKDLAEAWKAAGTLIAFVKIVGYIAVAFTATWGAIKVFKGG